MQTSAFRLVRFLICICLAVIAIGNKCAYAQYPDEKATQVIEAVIEEMAANNSEDTDYSTLFDDLIYFYNNPINLNEATREQLNRLVFLNDLQTSEILDYLNQYHYFLTLYELQLIESLTQSDIQRLLPFVTLRKPVEKFDGEIKDIFRYGRNTVFLRTQRVLETQKGFKTDSSISNSIKYLGNPYKYYLRYQYQFGSKLSIGATAEKDPGEEFFKGSQPKGFDYYSAFIYVQNWRKIKSLAIGDYTINIGQGLLCGTGIAFGKSPMVMSISRRNNNILKKYSSTNENEFMRGVAANIELGEFNVYAAISHNKLDANLTESDSKEENSITSILNTGLHATASQVEDKDAITESIVCSGINYKTGSSKFGLNFIGFQHNQPHFADNAPYRLFENRASQAFNVSVDYQTFYRKHYFFGELATSSSGKIAVVNGYTGYLVPRVGIALLHRFYARDYYALLGNGFSEGSRISNENGMYIGTQIYLGKYSKLSAYFDTFRFPWLKYTISSPSLGNEYFIQYDYSPRSRFNVYCRYKYTEKEYNIPQDESQVLQMKKHETITKRVFRVHFSYQILDNLQMANSIIWFDWQNSNARNENGFLIYQDIKYQTTNIPLSIILRYALFDTDSYFTRIYTYENDALYCYSVPALYEKGSRFYVLIKYSASQNIDLWLRYAQTYFSNLDVNGTGSNEIEGKTKSEIKVQLRIKF